MSAQDEDPPGARRASTHTADPAEPARLVEDPAVRADVSAAWALGLLRGAEPYRAPAGRKQRVQLRLGHTPRRHAPLVLRLAVMALVLCGGAAIVSAALGHWPGWMASAYERVIGNAPRRARARPARERAARARAALREAVLREAPPIERSAVRRSAAQRDRTAHCRQRDSDGGAGRAGRSRAGATPAARRDRAASASRGGTCRARRRGHVRGVGGDARAARGAQPGARASPARPLSQRAPERQSGRRGARDDNRGRDRSPRR